MGTRSNQKGVQLKVVLSTTILFSLEIPYYENFVNFDLKDINTEMNNLAIQIATNNLGDGHLPNLQLSNTSSNSEIFLIRLIYL